MSEQHTICVEAFKAGVDACFNGACREVPEEFTTCRSARHSWIVGYDAARPYRQHLESLKGQAHA